MARWRVQLLGGLSVAGEGWTASTFPTRRSAQMLARIALSRTGSAGRDELAEALWPEDLLDSTRVRLRQELKRLKSALGPAAGIIQADRNWLRLDLDEAEVDARIFAQSARAALARQDPGERRGMLARAAGLYQGPLLPEFSDLWAFGQRLEMRSLFDQASSLLLQDLEKEGLWGEAGSLASRMLGLDPLKEQAVTALMKARRAEGDAASALAVYSEFERAREKAGEAAPEGEARLLASELRRAGAAARPAPPAAAREEASAGRSLMPPPAYHDEFVGRQEELRTIREALLQPRSGRLVTLVGPGGVGKTRLSVEASRSLGSEAGEAVFLAVERHPGQDLAESASSCVPRGRPFLLLLDNCEADPEAAASGAKAVLDRFPEGRILATSRQRLGLAEERVAAVAPLSLPVRASILEEALACDAVRLFVDRIRRSGSGLVLTDADAPDLVRLAAHLDGLPLALELAASRAGASGLRAAVDEIDDRFSWLVSRRVDVPDRQRSLWAAIDWSWQGLSQEERLMLKALAYPRGGASPALAEALYGAPCLGVLEGLVEKSLASASGSGGEARFRLLDSVREFVRRQPEDEPLRQLPRRLAAWALSFLQARGVEAGAPTPMAAQRPLFIEQENLHQAIEAASDEDPESALETASRLGPFWVDLGRPREGLAAIIQLFGRELPATLSRARCEFFAGRMASVLEDLPLSAHWLARGAVTAREAGHEGLARICDLNQTAVDLDLMRLEECLAGTLASAEWHREDGTRPGNLLVALCQAGVVLAMMGRFDEAHSFHEEAMVLASSLGSPHLTLRVCRDMAFAAGEEGDLEASIGLSHEALACLEEGYSALMDGWIRLNLLGRLVEAGRLDEAREQDGSLRGMAAEFDGPHVRAGLALSRGRLALREGRLSDGADLARDGLRIALASGRPGPMAEGAALAAALLAESGRLDRSGALCAGLRALAGVWITPSVLRWIGQTEARGPAAAPGRRGSRLEALAVKAAADLSLVSAPKFSLSRSRHAGEA